MAKIPQRQKAELPDNACPRCWVKKNKVVLRDDMAKHYKKKHSKQSLPDRFYQGPRDVYGKPIAPYVGKFVVGTRVKLRGFYKKGKGSFVDGAQKSGRHFDLYPEFESYMYEGLKIIGKKGTVYEVSPAGNSGHPLSPAWIHVLLDKPLKLKYYDKLTVSVLERELIRLKSREGN